jgi:predicted CoA-binding protein
MLRSILRLPTPSFLAQRHLTSVTTAPTKQEEPLAGQLFYPDPYVRDILATTQTIAVIGASTNPSRPSYFAMKYLQAKGFKIVPINPGAAGQTILGEVVRSDLQSLPKDLSIDMVDVFRRSEDTLEYARQAKDIGAKHLWLQLGVVNHDTRRTAEAEGALKLNLPDCLVNWGGWVLIQRSYHPKKEK